MKRIGKGPTLRPRQQLNAQARTLTSYDVLFLRPPSFTDYRKKPWFPGLVARTVAIFSPLFIMIPLGVLSIAQYLTKNGLQVKIMNLAERTLDSKLRD